MKILYIHGFGSRFDPEHEKIKQLEELGTVVGIDVEYCKGFRNVFEAVLDRVLTDSIDLVVGTSMGGYMATHVSQETGVPFVALNPATHPSETLQKWIGSFTDYAGRDHYLSENIVEGYPDVATGGAGLVITESNDEVIDARMTETVLSDFYEFHMIQGGSHRFEHMEKAIGMISQFLARLDASHGV